MSNSKTSIPVPTPSHPAPILTGPFASTLHSALHEADSLPRIQSSLTHELSASGWTANLRAYVLQLLRSGECTTIEQVMSRVLSEARNGIDGQKDNGTNGAHKNGVNGVNGEIDGTKSVEEGGIKIPETVVTEGVKVVKKELEHACDIKFDDEE